MANFHGFFTEKYHEYGIRISWKKHGNPLNIQHFRAHEKTLKQKIHKNVMNKMKHVFFHGFLMITKKPWIEKLFFMVSEFTCMGFSWGFFNSCPIKNHEFSVNGWILMVHEKWNGFWWHFHYPWIIPLAYFSWERQRHGHHENLVLNSLLFSTVKSNT